MYWYRSKVIYFSVLLIFSIRIHVFPPFTIFTQKNRSELIPVELNFILGPTYNKETLLLDGRVTPH